MASANSKSTHMTLRVPHDLLADLKHEAGLRDVPLSTFIIMALQHRVDAAKGIRSAKQEGKRR